MLKKIIKTHTARLDFVDIIKPAFIRNAVATNRQRRVIASFQNDWVKIHHRENKVGWRFTNLICFF